LLPDRPIEQTPILFGGAQGTYSSILKDWLMAVCQRHPDYQDPKHSIRIAVLNLLKPEMRIDGFIKQVENKLNAMA